MIKVENDYETVKYEEPFHSHIYENQFQFLSDYYTRPRKNYKQTEQKVNKVTIAHEPEEEQVSCLHTNHIYQNVPKVPPREKFGQLHFS